MSPFLLPLFIHFFLPSPRPNIFQVTNTLFCRIPIHERVELPESWIPADSRVEIDAKITAGMSYFFRIPSFPFPFPFRGNASLGACWVGIFFFRRVGTFMQETGMGMGMEHPHFPPADTVIHRRPHLEMHSLKGPWPGVI